MITFKTLNNDEITMQADKICIRYNDYAFEGNYFAYDKDDNYNCWEISKAQFDILSQNEQVTNTGFKK